MRSSERPATIPVWTAVLAANALMGPPVEARDDWRLWLEQRWSLPVSSTLTLTGKAEERFQDDLGDYHVQVASVGVSWKPVRWLALEPAYHYQWTERSGDDQNEHRIFLSASPSWSSGPLQVAVRHRVEFRRINGRDDWRYRNRPKLSLALGTGRWRITPYVADEVFYGARAGEWDRNRLLLGVEKPLTPHLGAELYYMMESNKAGRDWDEFHVLGVVMDLAL